MLADAEGGAFEAANLIVTCGCNQEMSITHVLDYMGLHAAHRMTRLMALVTKLFHMRVPKPQRRKMIALAATDVLIHFTRTHFNPPKLAAYQEWLEVDALDLAALTLSNE